MWYRALASDVGELFVNHLFISPTYAISMVYVGATPEFRCADGFDANATFASLPADTPQCHRINDTNSSCTRWVFDTSVYLSTVVTEWNLVCGRKPLLSMLQSWLMIGSVVGSLVGGQLSDRFGRRPVFLPTMFLTIACSLATALVGTTSASRWCAVSRASPQAAKALVSSLW